jgi:hypothetical protein
MYCCVHQRNACVKGFIYNTISLFIDVTSVVSELDYLIIAVVKFYLFHYFYTQPNDGLTKAETCS